MNKQRLISFICIGLLATLTSKGQKNISIDATQQKQTIDGFGGSLAYYDGWLPAHPNRSLIYDYLFRDLGLSILRLRNTYMNEGGNNPDMDNSKLIVAEAKKRGSFDIMISSWSPPGKYKSNGKPANDETMASLALDSAGNFVYGDFAKWWYKSLLEYKKIGIEPKYISIQNEPNWNPGYEGCIFMPNEQVVNDKILGKNVKVASYAKAFNSVYDTIAKYKANLNIEPKMIGPEVLGIENAWSGRPEDYTKYMNMTKCYAMAHHLYTGANTGNMSILNNLYPDKPKMQTEYSDKEWFELSKIIQSSLVSENVTAYLVWDTFWPGESSLITTDFPWNSAQWVYPKGFKVTTKYYMFKQFAYFIKPGWKRVSASISGTSVTSSAFINPENTQMSIVLINTATNEDSVTISPKSFTISSGKIYATTESLNCSLIGDYSGGTVVIPGTSVTTISLQLSTNTTGLDIKKDKNNVPLIYPNPFSTESNLDLRNFDPGATIEIYNLMGKALYQKKVVGNSLYKIGAELTNGVYILNVTDGQKKMTSKIVKQLK